MINVGGGAEGLLFRTADAVVRRRSGTWAPAWRPVAGLGVKAGLLGTVKRLFTNGAQDVMEVAGEATRLLPWVPAVVKKVDLAERTIHVEWGADW